MTFRVTTPTSKYATVDLVFDPTTASFKPRNQVPFNPAPRFIPSKNRYQLAVKAFETSYRATRAAVYKDDQETPREWVVNVFDRIIRMAFYYIYSKRWN